ncbi:metal dependent phosphohydrolase [Mycobacteroides abscessus subsp. abscessus]|uniref:HD domain-containing protein n=1 Tax=Mycobacteroides abscessus TaxID=36809 RepID=UPI0009261AF9|nr:HD domain-containing protein [Mycobacteroides abscessus]MDM2351263.1 HD domain-containing protein [Mycobacteroides abscessus]MDM2361349.1 HD domain-containing protein [Mycobacteroides abscessus]QSN53243.1 HD domain-containing protein [Mycobacteroides abscessus subsp. abscessus]SII21510.1 metal dependent phosphohydrolase [Mycobacteroides abscessus subsp. abscessus]SII81625.1 metal dependent phosphohydrolase [Mycobacteroides abscessus subsp. abscessus]
MSGLVEQARKVAESGLCGLVRRWAHVQGVAAAATQIRGHFDEVSGDCLVAAAWTHDIGYAPSVRVTGFHPLDGACFLRDRGFPTLMVSLVAHHSGARIEAQVRGVEGLSDFAEPDRELLDALTFCDLTTGPDGTPVSAAARLDEVLRRYRPDDPVHQAIDLSRDDLLAAVGRVQSWL